jgi:hypothetical protein
MESVRSLIHRVTTPKESPDDKQIFTEEIAALIEPHMQAALRKYWDETQEDTSYKAHRRVIQILLADFFELAKTDNGLNKFMFPIMMYLRKARNERMKPPTKTR